MGKNTLKGLKVDDCQDDHHLAQDVSLGQHQLQSGETSASECRPRPVDCHLGNIRIESVFSRFDIERTCLYLHLLGLFKYWVGHEAAQEETEGEVLPEHLPGT